jgi:purine-binding chemotaxis protein CheW
MIDAAAHGGAAAMAPTAGTVQLVTVHAAGQYLGLPIDRVRDVFLITGMARVPRAPKAVSGLVNLRGKIVTMLGLATLLGRNDVRDGEETMAVGVEWHGESFGLTVERVGEVLALPADGREPNPSHLDPALAVVSNGVHRLKEGLLVEINLDALLATPLSDAA